MDISPEGLEIKFPEESPLAVRRSKTTRGKQTDKRQRVPRAPGPRAGACAHSKTSDPPGFSSSSSILGPASHLESWPLSSSLPGLSPTDNPKVQGSLGSQGQPSIRGEDNLWITAPASPACTGRVWLLQGPCQRAQLSEAVTQHSRASSWLFLLPCFTFPYILTWAFWKHLLNK